MTSILAAAMLVAMQSADSTLIRLEGVGLSVLPGDVPAHYSEGARERAESLQDATRKTIRLIRDSLDAVPPEIRLAVLNEADWSKVAPWQLPYGIHTVAGPPHVFVVPSETDRGQYFDSLSAAPELRVDQIGLHYLAHHLALAIYPAETAGDPPVKWLDEIVTLIVEDYLFGALDPRLMELESLEEEQVSELRVTSLAGFEEEYNGYFSTREGASNYRWFIERLDEAGRAIMREHGWRLLRELRLDLRPDLESQDAQRLLSAYGVDLASVGLVGG